MTDNKLADALDCFWNAAIGAARDSQDTTAISVAGAMAQGFAAVADRLREHSVALAAHDAPDDALTRLRIQGIAAETLKKHGLLLLKQLEIGGKEMEGGGYGGGNLVALMELFAERLAEHDAQPAPAPVQPSSVSTPIPNTGTYFAQPPANGDYIEQRAWNLLADAYEASEWKHLAERVRKYGAQSNPDAVAHAAIVAALRQPVTDAVRERDAIDGDNGFRVSPWTYTNQPGNLGASALGRAAVAARPGGDSIDHGLSLLRELHLRGFGIVRVSKLESAIASQQESRNGREGEKS